MPRDHSSEPSSQTVLDSAAELDRLADAMAEDAGPRVFFQNSVPDKYAAAPAEPIDCENRVALCKGACCRLNVPLSPQDLAEGIVSWDVDRRYFNGQESDGYCVHLERPACRCSIYANRPAACRIYDCRNDQRIWVDFEKRIPNPALEELHWPLAAGDKPNPQLPAAAGRRNDQQTGAQHLRRPDRGPERRE